MDKSILDVVHHTAKELYAAGLMKEAKLSDISSLCLTSTEEDSAKQAKRMRPNVTAKPESSDLAEPN